MTGKKYTDEDKERKKRYYERNKTRLKAHQNAKRDKCKTQSLVIKILSGSVISTNEEFAAARLIAMKNGWRIFDPKKGSSSGQGFVGPISVPQNPTTSISPAISSVRTPTKTLVGPISLNNKTNNPKAARLHMPPR